MAVEVQESTVLSHNVLALLNHTATLVNQVSRDTNTLYSTFATVDHVYTSTREQRRSLLTLTHDLTSVLIEKGTDVPEGDEEVQQVLDTLETINADRLSLNRQLRDAFVLLGDYLGYEWNQEER